MNDVSICEYDKFPFHGAINNLVWENILGRVLTLQDARICKSATTAMLVWNFVIELNKDWFEQGTFTKL